MKNLKITLGLAFVIAFVSFNFSTQIFAVVIEDKNFVGQLHGKISAPKGVNISSVVIQVIGANPRDKFIYYTSPNAYGEFNFDGLLPSGSLVQLYVWDGNGVLNRTVLSAYVSPPNAKEIGTYEIILKDTQYTQDMAIVNNVSHDFISSGLCGSVVSYRRNNMQNVKILAYDRLAKYNGPLYEQDIDTNDNFCFFNLTSSSGTDMYDFVISGPEGESKTFTFYLPPTTFVHNAVLDTNASLYRPIRPYFWKENFFSQQSKQWEKLDAVNLSTNDDYAFVTYNESMTNENLFYFPLSNEVLEVSYFLNGENENRFFILVPRTKLFREIRTNEPSSSYSDRVYVDYKNPFPLKLVTEEELIKLNSNFYFQTWSKTFGSVFINIDLSQFNIQKTNEVKLSLRNAVGQEVGEFEELITVQEHNLLGFFLNQLPGRYQLFLTNLKGELLWTYEVRSYPNRIQVVTNDLDQLKSGSQMMQNKHQVTTETKALNAEVFQSNIIDFNDSDSIDADSFHSLQEEKLFLQNNILYKYNSDVFCKKVKHPSVLENLVNLSFEKA